eukprot:378408_1
MIISIKSFNFYNYNNDDNYVRFFLFFLINDVFDDTSYENLSEMFPNVPQAANEATIESLPMSTFKRKENVDAHAETNKCCICLEMFVDGDQIRRLPCLHIFHKKEIYQCLIQNIKCPICRINV